jgi:5-methylcytosine-specific restriction endonuclease McrA
MREQGGRCYWCERKFPPEGALLGDFVKYISRSLPTRDHVIPLARGGPNIEDNIVAACRRCNEEKSDMMPDEFLRWRYELNDRSNVRGYWPRGEAASVRM